MLLKNHSGCYGSLETVNFVVFNHLPKRAHRAAILFPVVWHLAEEALHLCRCVESLDQLPLARREALSMWLIQGWTLHKNKNTTNGRDSYENRNALSKVQVGGAVGSLTQLVSTSWEGGRAIESLT